ncbi:MAG: 4a-hydroxytetrahydrobiopterin dehydratase [Halobacteriaceae archaeon]
MADLLSDEAIERRLPSEWAREGDEIVRTYEFDDYLEGVAFATEVAEIAEEEFHHPELTIGYETVEVRFTSHEEGGITEKDIDMAERCDEIR